MQLQTRGAWQPLKLVESDLETRRAGGIILAMGKQPDKPAVRLEDLPNIGKSIAADLRSLGIRTPADLALRDPMTIYQELGGPMGKRHDPCVFYTLLAAEHFLKTSEALPWWKFTDEGKRRLRDHP